MILIRLLNLITLFLVLTIMGHQSFSTASPTPLIRHTSKHIRISNGSCLSFGTKVARLRPCNATDPNQNIHMLKINQTYQVFVDNEAKHIMCYDNRYRKIKIFGIKRLLKLVGPKDQPNQRRHKSTFGEEEANLLLESTRKHNNLLECGVHEESPGNGYQYFRFGDADGEELVWKSNGMLVKAKDIYCKYREGEDRKPWWKRYKGLKLKRLLKSSNKNNTELESPDTQSSRIRKATEDELSDGVLSTSELKNRKLELRKERQRRRSQNRKRRKRIRQQRRKEKGLAKCKKSKEKFREFMYDHITTFNPSLSLTTPWLQRRIRNY